MFPSLIANGKKADFDRRRTGHQGDQRPVDKFYFDHDNVALSSRQPQLKPQALLAGQSDGIEQVTDLSGPGATWLQSKHDHLCTLLSNLKSASTAAFGLKSTLTAPHLADPEQLHC
ncbi:hypothetical protein JCM11641_002052 [Rhodosporidiobolus odoratus]